MWQQQVMPSLLPYARYKETKRHRNLQVGDVCLLHRVNKIKGSFQLCRVVEIKVDEDNLVRTAQIELVIKEKKRSDRKSLLKDKSWKKTQMEIAVQRLVLILPSEEQTTKP